MTHLGRLCRCGHRFEAHDHWRVGTECVICGAPGCARFRWRWWPWARTLAAVAVVAVAIGLLGACSSASSSPRPRPAALPPPPCTWYSAAGADQVEIVLTGPACHGGTLTLMGWIAKHTGREWDSTTTAASGTLLAQEARAGSVVRVWFTGPPSGPAGPVAGRLADDLMAAGWSVQLAPA